MGTRKTRELPAQLVSARRRFERWRRTRKGRTPIPDPLWASAVKLAGTYGISRTASVLRVHYYSLKERVDKEAASSAAVPEGGSVAPFVELAVPASPSSGSGECLLELEDAGGAKMRIHLKGVEAPDLAALSRSFWGLES